MTTSSRSTTGSTIRRYTDLIVWQNAMALAREVYLVSKALPADERFGVVQQVRRASVSVPANIAEGHGRMTSGDCVRHLA